MSPELPPSWEKYTAWNFGLSRKFRGTWKYVSFFFYHKSIYSPPPLPPLALLSFFKKRFSPTPTPQHCYPLERPVHVKFISGLVDSSRQLIKKACKFAAKKFKRKFSKFFKTSKEKFCFPGISSE